MKTILFVSLICCATTLELADGSYFPIKTKAGSEGLTAFESEWYGKSLERMKEPRLHALVKDVNADAYRMMILPTWGNSIVVRVQRHGDLYSLSARRVDRQVGYEPSQIVEAKGHRVRTADSK